MGATAIVRAMTARWPLAIRLPTGQGLSSQAWSKRHRAILWLLGGHAVGLPLLGLYMGASVLHSIVEGSAIAALALLASVPTFPRRLRSVLGSFGLMSSSGVLVHLSGGYIEAHFHFFVMLGVIFLYEDWVPYVLSVAYVATHHGIVGTLDPLSVYNHPSAIAAPWRWAAVHAFFVLGLSAALVAAWNAIERARDAEARAAAEAQDLKRQLHTHEKMAALGSLVSGLAHEVRTPVTIAATNASILELAAKRTPDNELAPRIISHTGEILSSMDRINALVSQLRKFHGLIPDEFEDAALDVVVMDAVRLFASANRSARVIQADLQPTATARIQSLGVQQVALHLLTNALEATDPAKGVIRVATRQEGNEAVLRVEDNGVGMSADTQAKAFEPLFSTKEGGMGLGLHIVRRIVEVHGGRIECRSNPGAGTSMEVRFPSSGTIEAVPILTIGAAPQSVAFG